MQSGTRARSTRPAAQCHGSLIRCASVCNCQVATSLAQRYQRSVYYFTSHSIKHVYTAQDHLHPYRRSARTGDLLAAPDCQGFHALIGRGCRNARHLAGRPDHRCVSGLSDGGTEGFRRTGGTRRAHHAAGSQHHQAAEHQRFGAAAESCDRRTARSGLQAAVLPGRSENRR